MLLASFKLAAMLLLGGICTPAPAYVADEAIFAAAAAAAAAAGIEGEGAAVVFEEEGGLC